MSSALLLTPTRAPPTPVLEVQGIFRLSGGAESVRNLKKAFDTSTHQQSTFLLQERASCARPLGGRSPGFYIVSQARTCGTLLCPTSPRPGLMQSRPSSNCTARCRPLDADLCHSLALPCQSRRTPSRFMKELPEPLVPNDFYKLFLDLQKERCHDTTARLVSFFSRPAGRNDSFSRCRLSLISRPQRDLRELIFKMPPAHRYADIAEPTCDDI